MYIRLKQMTIRGYYVLVLNFWGRRDVRAGLVTSGYPFNVTGSLKGFMSMFCWTPVFLHLHILQYYAPLNCRKTRRTQLCGRSDGGRHMDSNILLVCFVKPAGAHSGMLPTRIGVQKKQNKTKNERQKTTNKIVQYVHKLFWCHYYTMYYYKCFASQRTKAG